MTYMIWQINDMKRPLDESIQQAMEHHRKKYGPVPTLVEHSKLLASVPPILGVRYRPICIPANILLLAVE